MIRTTNAALFFLAAGIFTSVTILSAYQILFAIPLVYYTWLAIKNKDYQLPTSAKWLLAFTAVAFISLVVNYELVPKPSKNFGRLKYFLFGVGGIFVFRVWLKDVSDKTKKILLNTFFVSIILAGLVMIYQAKISSEGRIRGLTDTMRYGYGTGMILLPIISGLLRREENAAWFDWRFAGAALIFGLIGMHLSETRGAFLGFVCGLPFVIYFFNKKLGTVLGFLITIGVAALGTYYLTGAPKNDGPRLLHTASNNSDNIRRSQWQSALIATQEKPFWGWGYSNFHSQLKRIKNQYDLARKDYDDAHSHNVLLEVSSGTGLIGLFFFLGWLIFWALEVFKNPSIRPYIIPLGVSFIVSGIFEVTLDANNASMLFALYSLGLGFNHVKQS